MKLENIVCDIEYAKKLKELGVSQESLFYWVLHTRKGSVWTLMEKPRKFNEWSYVSAFTCTELWGILPKNNIKIQLTLDGYRGEYNAKNGCAVTRKKGSNAMAKLLQYILENELLVNNN